MSDNDEIRALKEELEQLRAQAGQGQASEAQVTNGTRQREIVARLATLGVQLG